MAPGALALMCNKTQAGRTGGEFCLSPRVTRPRCNSTGNDPPGGAGGSGRNREDDWHNDSHSRDCSFRSGWYGGAADL